MRTLYPSSSRRSLRIRAILRVTSASGVPSENVMPLLMAEDFTAPAAVVPEVTLGVLSGWQ